MKDSITQADVLTAIQQLRAAGKKPTARNIHASLGRGSFTTILAFRREIDSSAPIQTAEPDKGALEHFHQVWHTAYTLGYNSRDAEVQDLKESIEGVTQENDALQTATADAQSKLIDAQTSRDDLVKQLAATVGQATEARAASDRYAEDLANAARTATKLATALETVEKLRAELAAVKESLAAAHRKIESTTEELTQAQAANAIKEGTITNLTKTLEQARARVWELEPKASTEQPDQKGTHKAAKKAAKKTTGDLHPATPGYTKDHAEKLVKNDSTPELPNVTG